MDTLTETIGSSTDPRLNESYVRECPGGSDLGDVVLVGVVHDHPASQYRVRRVVEATNPETLALELPPLAVPLFEAYAADATSPRSRGGEMSAAIRTDAADRTVGIDGPTLGFVDRLARTLYEERASLPTVVSSARAVASVAKHAVVCRLAAVAAARTPIDVEVDAPNAYETDARDDPTAQADDERRQVRKAQFVLQAFGSSRAGDLRDSTRESYMADRLSTLRRHGDVVAVVGIDHLDPLVEALETGGED